MKIFLSSFQSVAVLLGIGLLGFFVIRRRIVSRNILDVLSPLIIDIAIPCMVFTEILTRFQPEKMPGWWTLPLWWAGFTVVTFGLTKLSQFAFPEARREAGISLLYPNAVFTPLVLIPGLFGEGHPLLTENFFLTIFFPMFLFNTYAIFFGTGSVREKTPFDWRKLANPILIATLAAVALKLTGFSEFVPAVVLDITRPVGAIAFPLIMILIGGSISVDFEKSGSINWPLAFRFVLFKNIIFPAAVLGILALVRPPFPAAFLLLLQSALPPVTAAPILAGRAGGSASISNQFLVASFVASLLTIPLAVWAFGLVFPF